MSNQSVTTYRAVLDFFSVKLNQRSAAMAKALTYMAYTDYPGPEQLFLGQYRANRWPLQYHIGPRDQPPGPLVLTPQTIAFLEQVWKMYGYMNQFELHLICLINTHDHHQHLVISNHDEN